MEVKRDILWRVYVGYILVAVICAAILVKAFYIQQVEGKYWRSMNDSLHERMEEISAERGTIYSEDGEMLSTSIPEYDIYVDFDADGLHENNGKLFHQNVDSLSYDLSTLFKDRTTAQYRHILENGFSSGARSYPLLKKVNFGDYEKLKQFPLVRLGRNKSGFVPAVKSIRLNPYQILAFRTIGLDRENSQKVGLEQTYDTLLKGKEGKRLVRYIAGGVGIPVDDDYQVEPENGKDIVTTIDTHIQDITENALMNMLISNDAQHGCAIVLEVKTGKVKAIANLGKRPDGTYWEDLNYAMQATEPGSTFKLVTLMSLLSDKKISLGDMVNLEGGRWNLNGSTVIDAEPHDKGDNIVTAKRAFEISSNVGMAKLAFGNYETSPWQFINHVKQLGLDSLTGIDLAGERPPHVTRPGTRNWNSTIVPWMAFGYNVEITPMHTAMLYNAIANNGTMMRPYLLSSVIKDGVTIKETQPAVAREKICSDDVLQQVKQCLRGVCSDSGATAAKLFRGTPYLVDGKTGTALVADGKAGYSENIFQSSFAGFFPADNPQYTCVVVIVNKPNAVKHVGAMVAGPVFKEISDKLYSMYVKQNTMPHYVNATVNDSASYNYAGNKDDMKRIMSALNISYNDNGGDAEWAGISKLNAKPVVQNKMVYDNQMPQLTGMGLKDAVYICENMGLKVNIKGKGKVASQSIVAGTTVAKGATVGLMLN